MRETQNCIMLSVKTWFCDGAVYTILGSYYQQLGFVMVQFTLSLDHITMGI